jgi:alkylation response protein AidB-like acyl-CoA dehydrogenase
VNANTAIDARDAGTRPAIDVARELGPILARRANEATDEDKFVTENFELLKSSGLVEAGVPGELGGAGAKIDDLATMLRTLGYHCGSTALAFSMHTHQVAIPAWRWMHQKAVAVEPLLRRVATERIVLLTSGGSDWIAGSGKAEKVDGGYRITACKMFSSGAPIGDLLMTSAVFERQGEPPTVLHFEVPMKSPNVRILDTWRTLGMRGTGSHDVLIEGYIVPETAVAMRREAGKWHPLFQVIATIAFPLVYSVYLGVAESARDIAVTLAKRKQSTHHIVELAGRMDTELTGARLAHESMLATARLNAPSEATVNQVMIGKQLVTRHAMATVDLAMVRDMQAARYHPLQSGPQAEFAGAMALGLSVDRIF